MNSDDLRRRYGELSQKIKSFKMASTRDFSECVKASRRVHRDDDDVADDDDDVMARAPIDTPSHRVRRPASGCVSRHEWTAASRLAIYEPDFLRRLHEQIWRSICYVKRQTTCFCDDEDDLESIRLQTRVHDLERQLYQIEDSIIERQATKEEVVSREEEVEQCNARNEAVVTPARASPVISATPTKEKENQLPAVYVPRKNRVINSTVNTWNAPISAQNLCTRQTDTAIKRQRIGPLYVISDHDGDKKSKSKRRRRDLAPLKVHKVMKDSTSWLYFKKK